MSTLYEQLGGKPAVDAAVDIFYTKVLADEALIPFFSHTDMNAQRAKQKAFLTYAFGGAKGYNGRNMREAHANAVAHGLDDIHFDKVAGHLQTTLTELSVSEDLINQVMALVATTRDDVLNR